MAEHSVKGNLKTLNLPGMPFVHSKALSAQKSAPKLEARSLFRRASFQLAPLEAAFASVLDLRPLHLSRPLPPQHSA